MITLETRFWEKVDRRGPDECWPWLGCKNARGYGRFRVDGRTRQAHRFAYQIAYSYEPGGLFVCHRCDNPSCVNPSHLFLGTCAENVADMFAKGRAPRGGPQRPRGAFRHLRPAEAAAIFADNRTHAAIARDYGVSGSTILRLRQKQQSIRELAALEEE